MDAIVIMEQASIETIAGIIQIAVAPVFLLAGIAGLLAVLSTRLGRITDRAREIEGRIPIAQRMEQKEMLHREATFLWHRIHLIYWAIRLCVGSALMVCLVIVSLFVGDLVDINLSVLVAGLFIVAMLLIISGLLFLLREVGTSTRRMRQGMEYLFDEPDSQQPGPLRRP